MTPETALIAAVQAALLAAPPVASKVGEKVFDEVPADDVPGKPPLVYIGPINRQRLNDPAGEAAWAMRMRLYVESAEFGRLEAWDITDAVSECLEGSELALAAPFECVDVLRVIQAGDVFDQDGFKTVFLDVGTTIQKGEP